MIAAACCAAYLVGALGFAGLLLSRGRSHHVHLTMPRHKVIAWGALWLLIAIWLPVAMLVDGAERLTKNRKRIKRRT